MIIKTNRINQVCNDLIDFGIESEVDDNNNIVLPIDVKLQPMVTFLSDYRDKIVNLDLDTSTIYMDFPK